MYSAVRRQYRGSGSVTIPIMKKTGFDKNLRRRGGSGLHGRPAHAPIMGAAGS
jgi:TRAP-type uncharacterized transport system fused permease subunit